jgi:hypothetical protein
VCIRVAPHLWIRKSARFLLGLLISSSVFAQVSDRSTNDTESGAVTLALSANTGVAARTVLTNITEIFVSPYGDDANAGTLAAPVRTLPQAQVLLRAQIARGLPIEGITVWLRGGTYALTSTLELNGLDSGSATSPVTWRAYQGEAVRITGSKFLDPTEFVTTTINSPIWNRLDTAARGNVMQIDLRAAGVTDFGTLLLRGFGRSESAALELIVNGKVQPLGRWPDVDQNAAPYNHGYMSIASEASATSFTTATDRMSRWTTAPDVWLHGYFAVYWADEHIPVQSVSAPDQRITLGSAPGFGIVAGQSWYAYNLLEEITQPGEWYLDRISGLLYIWPIAGFASAEVQVSVLDGPLFSLNGASYITLQGLQLESTRAGLIAVQDGTHNTLQQLVLRNAGSRAVAIHGGTNHRLSQSYILDSGEDGVIMSGGARTTLVPGSHVLEDSEIANNARFARTYHPAVQLEGVGHTVRNNVIHDTSHAAIMFTGNDHLIELNEIRNVLSATSDAGAIYTGRDWGARGNVIANNFIHNISSIFSSDAVYGIYLDDAVSGIEVRGNVVYRVAGAAIVSSGGRDNLITNNVLARNGTAFNTDARAYQWWKDQTTDWINGALLDGLKALNYQAEPWAIRYPQAAAIPNSWAVVTSNDGNPWLYPEGTEFALNVGYANTTWIHGLEHTVWFKTFDHNLSDQNPEFIDEDALDLTLQSGSPAFALPGFQAIPFKSIGLRAQAMPPAVLGSQLNLSVSKSGSGSGTVVSVPEGINCGTACSSAFAANGVVTLTAQPAPGSEFLGWGISCSGTTSCNVTMSSAKTVTAAFGVGTAGICGSANGSTTNSTPTANLCVAGTPSVVSGDGPWSWTCDGSNGGTNASCSASLGTPTPFNLITHYYTNILNRVADDGGKAFWQSEVSRMSNLSVSPNEAYIALALNFFTSAEFLARGFGDEQFVRNLYLTFYNREADQSGLDYWRGLLSSGLPRDMIMYAFMFSTEFGNFMIQNIGATYQRPEVGAVIDYYRGAFGRLPDDGGLKYWVNQFRTAQCSGNPTAGVYTAATSIATAFFGSAEYNNAAPSANKYISDLFNAFMRRSADLEGYNFWVSQVATGAQSKDAVRQQFVDSPEFAARVQAIAGTACTGMMQ